MKAWMRYTLCIAVGLVGGAALAISQVRGDYSKQDVQNGPWNVNTNQATAQTSALTRAKVAVKGIFALPAKEAMYYIAHTDSSGALLNGKCTYTVRGGEMDARWWSVTLYQGDGWLVKNVANRWSINGSTIVMMESKPPKWMFTIGPKAPLDDPQYLPTGSVPNFDLTLRVYHAQGALLNDPARAVLPSITKESCA